MQPARKIRPRSSARSSAPRSAADSMSTTTLWPKLSCEVMADGEFGAGHNMVIDLKVLVKSFNFNCEDRSCYAGNPRDCFLRVRESNFFIRQSCILWIIIVYIDMYSFLRATTSCRPPAARGSGRRGYRIFTFPFIGSSRASEGEASPQPNTMVKPLDLVLVLLSVAFWSLKKQAPNEAAKLPKVKLCESQTPRRLVFAFPLMHPLLMAVVCG